MEKKRKKVFISYSWEETEHQDWVLKLAGDLQSIYGIEVIIDRANIKPGSDLPYFMENSIDKADKVLVILTPEYKVKAESRNKGVGYETTMLSQELFESPITKIKIIPILRKGNKETSSPRFLSSKAYHSMVDDNNYDYQLFDLAKAISDESMVNLPPLGPVVDFSSKQIDPIIAKAKSIASEEKINEEINRLLFSYDGKRIADDEISRFIQIIKDKKMLYEGNTDLRFPFEEDHRNRFIIKSYGFSVSVIFDNIASNVVSGLKMRVKYVKGVLSLNGVGAYFPDEQPKLIREEEYLFDLDYTKQCIWKRKTQIYTSEEISILIFEFLISEIQKIKSKDFRGK